MGEKRIQPGEKVGLKLTAAERKLLLEGLLFLDDEYEAAVCSTPVSEPVMMTLGELDDFASYIAAEANDCKDNKKRKKLDAIFEKIQDLLEEYTHGEPPQTISIEDAKSAQVISDQAVQVAEWAATALAAAEQLGIKKQPLKNFWLAPAQRELLSLVPGISKTIKNKLAKEKSSFTVVEVASMTMALVEDLPDADAQKQLAALLVAEHLMQRLQQGIVGSAQRKAGKGKKPKARADDTTVFQFKITLFGSTPAIWRRIQVKNCTLDMLHEHIQTAMGWTNSHLHQFEINKQKYGDPELLDDGFGEIECVDSTVTNISDIVPKSGKRFSFKYEYDFGDGWEHEILFEGRTPMEKGKKYPVCLEGERACPPEDVGGIWGFESFLEALADPKHEEHEDYKEWAGDFDPEKFDTKQATKAMRCGLPDWREL